MSIVISDQALVNQIRSLAAEKHQTPEEIVAAAMAAYGEKTPAGSGDFWESIVGMVNSGDPTLAERDEEILREETDPSTGWEARDDDTASGRH